MLPWVDHQRRTSMESSLKVTDNHYIFVVQINDNYYGTYYIMSFGHLITGRKLNAESFSEAKEEAFACVCNTVLEICDALNFLKESA